ncbi:hypothetical protein niasHT_008235 [Heterodera trifolii]|uniref:Uncharacterized protein n=1 Tax=Heterodera trifolii TaxID=157864 RepID=A0ABD2LUW7_9BILA
MFPECRLVTADPAAEINANLTHQIGGTFVQAAVGGETATGQPVNFWGKDVLVTGVVERKSLPQIGIVEFLNNNFGWAQPKVVHDPSLLIANYTHQMFYRTFDRILRQGHFALLHTEMFTGAAPLHLFLRMFFVNVDQEV